MKQLFTALLLGAMSALAQAESWQFAVIGDTPYSNRERKEFPVLLREIEAANPAFILHAGDFKGSSDECDDGIFRDRLMLFNRSPRPFIYTPGDNEWTDCADLAAGSYDPIERLNKLRQLFFKAPRSLGRITIPVEQQSAESPENLRWQLGPVVFLSLNVPGPNNHYGLLRTPSAEFRIRNPLILDWLRQGFARARQQNARGIVILMQGDPAFNQFIGPLAHSGYRELLETLRSESEAFAGQVLLIHGDTHSHRIDQPLKRRNGQPLTNFTRLETFGSPFMGWEKVTIDSETPGLFRFETHIHPMSRFFEHVDDARHSDYRHRPVSQ